MEPFFFLLLFGRGRPGEESANGWRAVGVKVDVVGVGGGRGWGDGGGISEQFLPLPDDTVSYQAVVGALRPAHCSWDSGDSEGLELDSSRRGRRWWWGRGGQFSGLPFSGSGLIV